MAPGGLLDRCYASLRLPPRCWPGLKRLPELGGLLGRGGRGEALALAASYVAALAGDGAGGGGRAAGAHGKGEDAALAGPASAQQQPDLADLLRPLPASPSFGSAADVAALFRGGGGGGREGDDDAAVAVAAAAAAATAEVGGDSDSDLEADLLAERLAAAALSGGRSGGGGDGGSGRTPPPAARPGRGHTTPPPPTGVQGAMADALAAPLGGEGGVGAGVVAAAPPPPRRAHPPPAPKPARPPPAKAVAALWELLEGCIARPQEGGASLPAGSSPSKRRAAAPPPPPPPGAQPYDARSRTALKRVAHWLGVPWAKVGALEALVAVELAALAAAAAGGPAAAKGEASPAPAPAPTAPPATSAREAAARAAKVAGATLGIGALFAVTGGLAAPVVAAGLSAAISAVGGSAAATAAGAAVSGFLATSAGTALVAGGVGAGGGAFAGSRMARRVGDVQEFGFWEVRDDDEWDGEEGEGEEPGDGGGGGGGEEEEEEEEEEGEGSEWAGGGPPAGARPPLPRPGEASSAAPEETDSHPLDGSGDGGSAAAAAAAHPRRPPLLPPSGLGAGGGGEEEAHPAARRGAPRRRRGRRRRGAPPLLPAPLAACRRPEDQRLAVTVCVSGWARSRPDFLTPWRTASVAGGGSAASASGAQPDAARFALVWESRELMRLSAIVTAWVRNQAAQEAVKLALQHWLYAGAAAAAAAPMALVSVSNSIDSAWAMALDRAVKAGRLLAHVLMGGGAGGRPVTLVGYSMGARLVFHCLLELVRCADDGRVSGGGSGAGGGPPGGGGARGGGRAAPPPHPPPTPPAPVGGAGIVEHAILLGTPVTARPERWAMARRAVAGRLLNGYCRSDWVLGVAFRASSGLIRPAGGLCPVPVPGVENVNLGAVVSGHLDYGSKVPEILALTGLAD